MKNKEFETDIDHRGYGLVGVLKSNSDIDFLAKLADHRFKSGDVVGYSFKDLKVFEGVIKRLEEIGFKNNLP